MTKYLQTKTNSIEEAISSVVLGEAKFQVKMWCGVLDTLI